MDLQIANLIYSKVKKTEKKENFEDDTTAADTQVTTDTVKNITITPEPKKNLYLQLFSLLIGVFAAYLSWSCNTAKGIDTVPKVIYSLFAFFFGFLYLIYYALFRAGRCYPPYPMMYAPPQYPPQYNQGYAQAPQYPPQGYAPVPQYPQAPQTKPNVGGKKGLSKCK